MRCDVAIIGGGPAGLYAAWRLLHDPKYAKKTVCIFEASERLGGRILSLTVPELSYVVELGAMRYLPEQILISSLIKKLRLPTDDFKFETRGYFLRGKFIKDFSAGSGAHPYKLRKDERGKSPSELIAFAIQKALSHTTIHGADKKPEAMQVSIPYLHTKLKSLATLDISPKDLLKHFTEREWRLIKRYGHIENQPLYRIGFWDLVQRHLSYEGYNLSHDGGGYQSILSMWSAAEAIVWYLFDFAGGVYKTIDSGMAELTRALEAEITTATSRIETYQNIKVINLGSELHSVQYAGNQFTLNFVSGSQSHAALMQTTKRVIADTVILALPQPALSKLSFSNFRLEIGDDDEMTKKRFDALLDSVTANPLFKLFLAFDQPWFASSGKDDPECTRVYTDLQLRQIYQFGVARQTKRAEQTDEQDKTCLLLAYSDARFAEYWKRLDRISRDEHVYYDSSFEEGLSPQQKVAFEAALEYGTGPELVDHALEQLKKSRGRQSDTAPMPKLVFLKHWSDPPHFVGWHSWNMGPRPWKIAEKLTQPFIEARLFTCGEAFSSEQGWIEGALKSTERVLEKLGLDEPDWVDKKIYKRQKDLWL